MYLMQHDKGLTLAPRLDVELGEDFLQDRAHHTELQPADVRMLVPLLLPSNQVTWELAKMFLEHLTMVQHVSRLYNQIMRLNERPGKV